ncbi:MAG TPA: hypothetical protein PLL30_08215 [Candidatus Krumholzibacteria bacterium]|nr:hypothetical protein [Candidatus Krumholzibacteria bacterium]HPD71741.1 hypothetical protein [Candidatus Krumholzibacteria bacterium]HRY41326.1 hypothetical protein [Candidatus Krumholzibacteria bacterium]
MPTNLTRLLSRLSRADLHRLLVAKEEIEHLEERRTELASELAEVDQKLDRLIGRVAGTRRGPGRPAGRRSGRKVGRRTVKKAAKKTARRAARTTAGKAAKTAARKTATKTARKGGERPAPRGRRTGGQRATLENVVIGVLANKGEPMSFKAILETITAGKLFRSRSRDFSNVLRRTLSTSRRVKRVSRGVYGT